MFEVKKKKTEVLCFTTLKCKVKFEQKLICGLGDDKNKLANFEMSKQKLQMWNFHRLLLSKVYSGWAEKSTEVLCLMALKIHVKFEGKQTCGLKNDMNNWHLWTNYMNNWNLFTADTRVGFSNFIGLCFLKYKSLEQKTVSGVPFCDAKGLWKAGAKTE